MCKCAFNIIQKCQFECTCKGQFECKCECECDCKCNYKCKCIDLPQWFHIFLQHLQHIHTFDIEPSRAPNHSKLNCVRTNRPRHIHMTHQKFESFKKNNFRNDKIRIRICWLITKTAEIVRTCSRVNCTSTNLSGKRNDSSFGEWSLTLGSKWTKHAEICSNFSHSLSTAAFAAGIFTDWGIRINLWNKL